MKNCEPFFHVTRRAEGVGSSPRLRGNEVRWKKGRSPQGRPSDRFGEAAGPHFSRSFVARRSEDRAGKARAGFPAGLCEDTLPKGNPSATQLARAAASRSRKFVRNSGWHPCPKNRRFCVSEFFNSLSRGDRSRRPRRRDLERNSSRWIAPSGLSGNPVTTTRGDAPGCARSPLRGSAFPHQSNARQPSERLVLNRTFPISLIDSGASLGRGAAWEGWRHVSASFAHQDRLHAIAPRRMGVWP